MTDPCMQITFTYETKDKIECEEEKTSNRDIHVFKGILNRTIPIALKRYEVSNDEIWKQIKEDLKVLSSPDYTHVNLIRYYGCDPNIELDDNSPERKFK